MSHDTQVLPQSARGSLQEQIEGWLHTVLEAVDRAEEQETEACSPAKAGRPRSLPSKSLWLALLVGVLRGVRSQRAIWRLVTAGQGGEPSQNLSDQAVDKRLEQEGWLPLARLFERISQVLAHWLEPALDTFRQQHGVLAPFASEVVALDEMHLDQVKRRLPILRHFQKGAMPLLPGKLVALCDVRLQQWRAIDSLAQRNADGRQQARQLLNRVKKGVLVLADLGYVGFEWLDGLTTQGLAWISRIREDTTVVVIHPSYQAGETFDRIVWLGAWQTQARYAVRQVQFRQGGQRRQYVTNVCDPSVLPLPEIARLYARRWDIELAFVTLKREVGLHLIWSRKASVVLVQVWAALIVAHVVQAIRMEVALRAGVDAFEVSLP